MIGTKVRAFVPPNTEDAAAHATAPNLLQLTSALFLVPAAVCVAKGWLLGVIVYCSNAVCSVYVHRPNRTHVDTVADTMDKVCVAAWVAYNAATWYNGTRDALPVVFAGCVLVTKIWTRYLEYRSLSRYAVHTCMHLSGVAGSLLILV